MRAASRHREEGIGAGFAIVRPLAIMLRRSMSPLAVLEMLLV